MWQWLRTHPFWFILLATLIAYLPYFSARFVWDDEQFIFSNFHILNGDVAKIVSTSITDGAGVISNYFRPLTALSFALDYAIWGLNPVMFRFVNVGAHLLVGLSVFALLRKLKASPTAALVISGIFLLHPIQVEAVTYINARSNSFYALFGLLGLLCYTLAFRITSKTIHFLGIEYSVTRHQLLFVSLLLYLLAVFSKETALAVIGLYLLIFVLHWVTSPKRSSRTFLWLPATTLIGGFCLACIYLYLRTTVWNFNDTFGTTQPGDIYYESLYVRLHTFTKVFFIYQQKLLIPYPLHMEYLVEPITSWLSWWLAAFIALMSTLLFFGWRSLQRGNYWILLGLGWYFAPLVPVSGIVPVNGIMYESWLYVPIIGWGMTLYGIWVEVGRRYPIKKFKTALITLGLLLVLIYSGLIVRQNYYWSTPIRLYSYLLRYTESARIHNNLGMAYAEAGLSEEALAEYNRALELGYNYPQIHHNLANNYEDLGRPEEAIKSYRKALELSPDFYYSYANLLQLLVKYHPEEVEGFILSVEQNNPTWGAELRKISRILSN